MSCGKILRYINTLDKASSMITFTANNIIIIVLVDIIIDRIISIAKKKSYFKRYKFPLNCLSVSLKLIFPTTDASLSHGGMSEFRKVRGKLEKALKL